jgi:uncharacterized protein YbjT (DUF2867 family)
MIFVSGATGNVGYQVARCLLAQGIAIRAGDIDLKRIRDRYEPGVDGAVLRFGDSATYAGALAGIDRMFLVRPPQISSVAKFRRRSLMWLNSSSRR